MSNPVPDVKFDTEKIDLEKMIDIYLESNPMERHDRKINELEVRFGTMYDETKDVNSKITKIKFENVIKNLYMAGFSTDNQNGIYSLRIFREFRNDKGMIRMSNVRTEIVGIDLIQEYCKTNDIEKILAMPSTTYDKLKFTQKSQVKHGENFVKSVL